MSRMGSHDDSRVLIVERDELSCFETMTRYVEKEEQGIYTYLF
jgi:hypothetical protein